MVGGSANASFTKILANPTSSATFDLNGSAQLFGLGTVNLSGVVHTVGVNHSHAVGHLTLSSRVGTITLALTDPAVSATEGMPSDMTFTITSATGAYARAGGAGVISFSVTHTSSTTGTISMSLT